MRCGSKTYKCTWFLLIIVNNLFNLKYFPHFIENKWKNYKISNIL